MAETVEGQHPSGNMSMRLAEGSDLEEQINECIALSAIYENEDLEICTHDNEKGDAPGGIFNISTYPTQPFYVKMTKDLPGIRRLAFAAARGRGRKNSKSDSVQQESRRKSLEDGPASSPQGGAMYPIKRLPPLTLTFAFPHDYPSKNPPNFTLSCCWLEKKNLSKLCCKLDEIWTQCEGTVVVMNWVTFLQEEALEYLAIKSPYDLGHVLVHMFTHPAKDPSNTENFPHLTPKPFDTRIFQTFGSIEEVLPKVLDANLFGCEVCFEEKAGVDCLRLVSCAEHVQCKECVRGWFEEQIKTGAVRDLHCPGFKCDKPVLPTEVSHVVSPELYQRYEKLLLKTAFDVMTDVVNCPRPFCQFPVVLDDNLGVCQQCQHAFCGRCLNTYHGHSPCKLKADMYKSLYEEYNSAPAHRKRELEVHYGKQTIQRMINEVKSNQWLESNSKQCPSCGTFIQKKDGCNKMTCSNCRTFFCWLCQCELSRSNPYAHYMHPTSPCSNRLFEGIDDNLQQGGGGDEDDQFFNFLEEGGLLQADDNNDKDDDDDDDDDYVAPDVAEEEEDEDFVYFVDGI